MFSKIASIVDEYSIKAFLSSKSFIPTCSFFQSTVDILVLLNLWHTNKFYRLYCCIFESTLINS